MQEQPRNGASPRPWAKVAIGREYLGVSKRFMYLESLVISGRFIGALGERDSTFQHATLIDCDFRGARLGETSFRNASLYACDFSGAEILGCYFDGAQADENCIWPMGFDPKSKGIEIVGEEEEEEEEESDDDE